MLLLEKTLLLLTAPACQHSLPSYQASANSTPEPQPLPPLCIPIRPCIGLQGVSGVNRLPEPPKTQPGPSATSPTVK
jgi:hypothetical protein